MSLSVVLFVQGAGADPSFYRPERDESQWWGRRDALVRCVAAFLGSFPAGSYGCNSNQNQKKELIFLFDQDYTRIRMRFSTTRNDVKFLPTERNVIELWKRAAQSPGREVTTSNQSVSCTLLQHQDSTTVFALKSDSKREMLDYLQKECTIEFLRKHKLNSSAKVILRKTNKDELNNIWKEWQNNYMKQSTGNVLDTILEDLLTEQKKYSSSRMVGILHESSQKELPCWSCSKDAAGNKNHEVTLFLGAVRDMKASETMALQRVCDKHEIPIVRFRLGPAPEFTSKICTIVSAHFYKRILIPAMIQMKSKKRKSEVTEENRIPTTMYSSVHLTTVHSTELKSHQITTDPRQRNEALWEIVRSTVTSLWSSKVVSKANNDLAIRTRRHILLFSDDVYIEMTTEEFVKGMASRHEAAPSEYQVLKAILDRIEKQKETHFSDFLVQQFNGKGRTLLCVLGIKPLHNGKDMLDRFYTSNTKPAHDLSLIVILPIPRSVTVSPEKLQGLAESHKIELVTGFIGSEQSVDNLASTITMIQHFAYQDRLVEIVDNSNNDMRGERR